MLTNRRLHRLWPSGTWLPGLIDGHTHLFLDIIVPPEAEMDRHANGLFAPGMLLAVLSFGPQKSGDTLTGKSIFAWCAMGLTTASPGETTSQNARPQRERKWHEHRAFRSEGPYTYIGVHTHIHICIRAAVCGSSPL
jgi:hypothetical protein